MTLPEQVGRRSPATHSYQLRELNEYRNCAKGVGERVAAAVQTISGAVRGER